MQEKIREDDLKMRIVHLHFYQYDCYAIVALLNDLDLTTLCDAYEMHVRYVHFQRLSFRRAYFDS